MSAWAELVNADGSDEWLEKCEAALLEVQRETLRKAAEKIHASDIGDCCDECKAAAWLAANLIDPASGEG